MAKDKSTKIVGGADMKNVGLKGATKGRLGGKKRRGMKK